MHVSPFKQFLKWSCWVMVMLSVLHLPVLILNPFGTYTTTLRVAIKGHLFFMTTVLFQALGWEYFLPIIALLIFARVSAECFLPVILARVSAN